MTPIERACIAVIDNLREQGDLMADCGDPEWAQVDGAFRVEPVVRAVIAAIREPSGAMVKAGDEHTVYVSNSGNLETDAALPCWQAMIDAAMQGA